MPLEPPAMVQRLANGDAVEPGLKRAALAKLPNSAKCFQEDFLCAVGGVGGVAKHTENEVIDRPVVMRHEPVKRRFRASLQLGDEFGFSATPGKGAGPIGHFGLLLRQARPGTVASRSRTRCPLDTGPAGAVPARVACQKGQANLLKS